MDAGSIYIKDMMDFYEQVLLGRGGAFRGPRSRRQHGGFRGPCSDINVPGNLRGDLMEMRKRLQEADDVTDTDSKLAAAMQQSGDVIIPCSSRWVTRWVTGQSDADYIARNALPR